MVGVRGGTTVGHWKMAVGSGWTELSFVDDAPRDESPLNGELAETGIATP